MLFLILAICFIAQTYSYCFPGEILNLTEDSVCTFTVRESSGCGIWGICGGLKQLTISCGNSRTYGLPTNPDGGSVSDATFKLTTYLQANYSIIPVQIPSNGVDYTTSLCCGKNQVAYYNQIVLTFPKPDFTEDEIPCSGSTIISSFLMIAIIVWFCLV